MPLIRPKLTLAKGPLSLLPRDINKLPKVYDKAFAKNAAKPIGDFNSVVQKVPSKLPGHPFIWSKVKALQNKARRWWFAAIAGKIPGVRIETSGGRYKRKSDTIDAGATVDESTGDVTIEIPGGGFGIHTVSTKQTPSHQRTGWPQIDKEAEKLEDELIDVAITTWFDVGERIGGK